MQMDFVQDYRIYTEYKKVQASKEKPKNKNNTARENHLHEPNRQNQTALPRKTKRKLTPLRQHPSRRAEAMPH